MRRLGSFHLVLLVALFAGVFTYGPRATADVQGPHAVPLAVLGFDSDDAEEQADALTLALRSKVRTAPGFSLLETTQSLGMLTAALRCPPRPTAECEQRIAEQLRAERYLWGLVTAGPQPGQVTAEVHLYQRGRADLVVRETYAENLRDANDESLRRLAQRVVDRFRASTLGEVLVHAGTGPGEVIVDAEKRVPLVEGFARFDLAPGGHSIQVNADGANAKRNVVVTSGKTVTIEFTIAPPVEPKREESPFSAREVVGGVLLVTGAALGGLAVQQLLFYNELQRRGDALARPPAVAEGERPCDPNGNKEFCDIDKRARVASTVAWVAAGTGAAALTAGAYLLFFARDRGPARPRGARLAPAISVGGGGFELSGWF